MPANHYPRLGFIACQICTQWFFGNLDLHIPSSGMHQVDSSILFDGKTHVHDIQIFHGSGDRYQISGLDVFLQFFDFSLWDVVIGSRGDLLFVFFDGLQKIRIAQL